MAMDEGAGRPLLAQAGGGLQLGGSSSSSSSAGPYARRPATADAAAAAAGAVRGSGAASAGASSAQPVDALGRPASVDSGGSSRPTSGPPGRSTSGSSVATNLQSSFKREDVAMAPSRTTSGATNLQSSVRRDDTQPAATRLRSLSNQGKSFGSYSRQQVGSDRLHARDWWNTYEHSIQEIFMKYDKDASGALDVEEFRALLQDFHNGVPPSDQEYKFMMRISDRDHDGQINLGELHYAIRAWHSYCNLDDNVLRLFAEFDLDESGHLDPEELRTLLININGGLPVSSKEVEDVMNQADALGNGVISRPDLLGAISAWYVCVDRKETDTPSLLREAMSRSAQEGHHLQALSLGARSLSQASSFMVGSQGYQRVGEAGPPGAALSSPPTMHSEAEAAQHWQSAAGGSSGSRAWPSGSAGSAAVPGDFEQGGQPEQLPKRLRKAAPLFVRACHAFCYVLAPFVGSVAMVFIGLETSVNDCPRNLDGILIWFGLIGLAFNVTLYVESWTATDDVRETLSKARVAVVVLLAVLTLVGLSWSRDPQVEANRRACGRFLVTWSQVIWTLIPLVVCGYIVYFVASHYRRLQRQDQFIHNDVIVT
eukprot:TRINITY_DN10475_c0_g1_i1.p1 TRINITY_DN10475_c0_g1~~TRINITY_DN10475_c0_g1_i1.p1  ORF type:complete len:597 (+),score=87.54 TRINITY_DN10475_c0_g1_i1:75-1865(+)